MRIELPDFGLSLKLPREWLEFGNRGGFVVYGPPKYASYLTEPQWLPGGVCISRVPEVGDLVTWSEGQMARHVHGGCREWENTIVSGSAARIADWTDGVADILTTFVVRQTVGLRFEVWAAALNPADPPPGSVAFRKHLGSLLASVRWLD